MVKIQLRGSEKILRLFVSLLLLCAGLFTASYVGMGEARAQDYDYISSALNGLQRQFWQVRVEQRVIIRVPRQKTTPASISMGNARSTPIKYEEKKIGKCLMMDRLVGSRPGPKESLELVTRDGVLIRAYLGGGCLAREFYAGAYMERPLDGKLCIDRDLLFARTGAKCEIDKFRMLVAK
jgi:hypothetical protein